MSKPKYQITWGKRTMQGGRPFMAPQANPLDSETESQWIENAMESFGDVLRAEKAHKALEETLASLQSAFGTLFSAYDAYPDDLGKHEAYPAAIGTLAQTIKMVQALDVSARSWKVNQE